MSRQFCTLAMFHCSALSLTVCVEIQLVCRLARGEYSRRLICIYGTPPSRAQWWAALCSHYVHFVHCLQRLHHHSSPSYPCASILESLAWTNIDRCAEKVVSLGGEGCKFVRQKKGYWGVKPPIEIWPWTILHREGAHSHYTVHVNLHCTCILIDMFCIEKNSHHIARCMFV